MKTSRRILLAAGFVLTTVANKRTVASALTPSVTFASSTATALWKSQTSSSSAVQAVTNSDGETTTAGTTTTTAEIEKSTPTVSNSTTISSQVRMKSLELFQSLLNSSKTIASSSQLQSAVAVFGGTVLTYYMNNKLDIYGGPIMASSIVGIASALSLPLPLAMAAFCGSFAGMAKTAVIPSVGASTILGVLCAAMLSLFDRKKWLVGVGGRLGFVAQCACTMQFLVASMTRTSPASGASLVGPFGDPLQVLGKLPLVCLSTMAGALFMSLWKEATVEQVQKKKDDNLKARLFERLSNSVAAASVTGLVGASFFPAAIAGPAFCGSFIAMSAPTKLETYGSLIGASLMGGVCQLAMSGVLLGGWGGRLGTASLVGVLSYRLIASFSKKTTQLGTESV